MKNKINVAELLKDCPKGMELDCLMYDFTVKLDYIDGNSFPIKVQTPIGELAFSKYGGYSTTEYAKCVIFPKGKTTWEGFVPPIGFKDGDIVSTRNGIWIGIVKKPVNCAYETYITINGESLMYDNPIFCFERFATEEEKQKLFDSIKANGYKWNAETKTLEKLIKPKFKVGDRIKHKCSKFIGKRIITNCNDVGYFTSINDWIDIEHQDDWELAPNKFDITTLKPFDKVLGRDKNTEKWLANFWGFYDIDNAMNYPYECLGNSFAQCIPYESNEHLLGTTIDCDDYYKTWK